MKQKYTVTIAGKELTLLSEENEAYVKELASIIDRRVMELTIVKNRCSKMDAMTLLALDYLDLALKEKAEIERLKKGEKA